jgi:glycosyltransferase involved in cell wall biosynthesis
VEVVIVYKEDYPWDVRVEKIALTLKSFGFNVSIISKNTERKPNFEKINGLEIYRLPKFRTLPAILAKLLQAPIWFNPLWIYKIWSVTRKKRSSLIIVRDLPLIRSGLIVSKVSDTKLIFDMAEVYPYMYESSALFPDSNFHAVVNKIVKNPTLTRRYEKSVLRKVDHTFVMIEESRNRLIEKKLAHPSKITTVSNTPAVDKFGGRLANHSGERISIVYVGFLTELRGLDILILAISEFIKLGNNSDAIKLDIIGKGHAKRKLESLVSDLQLENSVTIHGWLSKERVEEIMSSANVGALTYRQCKHWAHTIPNKIFDYMLAGLPVLATDIKPIKRIVEETNCGLIATAEDPKDIALKLAKLKSPELRTELGANGHKAVENTYNWQRDAGYMLEAIQTLELG